MTPQMIIYFMGAIVATVIFWYKTQESWEKAKKVEEMVNKQWQLQREMNEKTGEELRDIQDWIKFRQGYEEAKKEFNFNTKNQ